MDKVQTKNDLTAAVPKFCLALETHRRTQEGRVRSSQEFLAHFFPYDGASSTDRVFRYMPNDVRGPILAAWGIRGAKAALRDTDEKVQSVVHDALVAGDIDHGAFEEGLAAETLVRWSPLSDWWTFWRGGKLTKVAIQKALVTAYELFLFDAKWFLETIEARGGKLRGTDVIADGLTKDDLTEWMRNVHASGDGSPKGILTAIGWDKVVQKTANDVLIAVIDAMVQRAGLSKPASSPSEKELGQKTEKAEPAAEKAPAATATPSANGGGMRPPQPSSPNIERVFGPLTSTGSHPAIQPPPAAGSSPSVATAAAAPSAPAVGEKRSVPPPLPPAEAAKASMPPEKEDDWQAPESSRITGLPPEPAVSEAEQETTVSQKGDGQAAAAGPESAGADDMIVVVDDEGMDLGATDAAPAAPVGSGQRHEPPTSPRIEAARPQMPEPAEPPKAKRPSTSPRGPNRFAR